MQQYICDSSYYIFYHDNLDTLYINAKNEGTEILNLSGVSTQSIAGASFVIPDFSPQEIAPGEMYTVLLTYQLPVGYVNGINGQISFASNDPEKPNCTEFSVQRSEFTKTISRRQPTLSGKQATFAPW